MGLETLFLYDVKSKSKLINLNGRELGTVTLKGYWQVMNKGKTYLAHRVVWELFNGSIPKGMQIDHINGDRLDNSIANLRIVQPKLNSRNKKIRLENCTGKGGVQFVTVGKYSYYRATSVDLNGKQDQVNYSVTKYGKEKAFKLAQEKRDKMISYLNSNGAGYTARNGEIN